MTYNSIWGICWTITQETEKEYQRVLRPFFSKSEKIKISINAEKTLHVFIIYRYFKISSEGWTGQFLSTHECSFKRAIFIAFSLLIILRCQAKHNKRTVTKASPFTTERTGNEQLANDFF